MFEYRYKIITPDRTVVEGNTQALCGFVARLRLRWQNNTVLLVQRKTELTTTQKPVYYVSVSSMQLIILFRNLSMMLDSGISISDALHNSSQQIRGVGMKTVLQNIYTNVSSGTPLSTSLSHYPKIFPSHLTKTIEVGEQSGTLSPTLDRISLDLERSYELRRKVIGAIAYPSIIVSFMGVTAILMVVMVLPQIIRLFDDLGAELPPTTRFLQWLNIQLTTHPIEIAGTSLLVIVGTIAAMRFYRFRLFAHMVILRIPVFGNIIREYSLSVFSRALGTLLQSGITFVQALETVRDTVRNESYKQKINQIIPIVMNGGSFSDALRQAPFHFPEQFRYTMEVGEQSGKLRTSFEKASAHYERSVLFQTQMITTIIEPILMLMAGVLVGFLALSIFGPIYDMTNHI